MHRILLTPILILVATSTLPAEPIVYEGESGLGLGKHIVFLAGDHEYRSEETLPALARILAKHHGFRCTVLITTDPENGDINPGSNHLPGTHALDKADLMVIFLRFQDFPSKQMQPIVDYLNRPGPVVGLRTSTHAFKIPKDSQYAKYSFRYDGPEYPGGFGRQVLGETWVSHYGKNHVMSTRLDMIPQQKDHPILAGVDKPWVQSGGYWVVPKTDSTILANAQPLSGMTADSMPAQDKDPCPGAWTRLYSNNEGQQARVFSSTYGASEDILNDDYRRMLINACIWAIGLEQSIKPNLDISFVGPYNPSTFKFNGHRLHVKPNDLQDYSSPIMPTSKSSKTSIQ